MADLSDNSIKRNVTLPESSAPLKADSLSGTPRLTLTGLQTTHAGPVSLALAAGECVVIVGESGAGKSVLLRMIADLEPSSGAVHLDGVSRESWSAPSWRGMVVYQSAEPAWWEVSAAAHFSAAQLPFAQALLPRLRLRPDILGADLTTLSTGERQRLALIRCLACRPKVLLLDEPAASLDAATTAALESVLQDELAAGVSMLVVTHSQEQAQRLGQRTLRMVAGRLESA